MIEIAEFQEGVDPTANLVERAADMDGETPRPLGDQEITRLGGILGAINGRKLADQKAFTGTVRRMLEKSQLGIFMQGRGPWSIFATGGGKYKYVQVKDPADPEIAYTLDGQQSPLLLQRLEASVPERQRLHRTVVPAPRRTTTT